MTLPILSEMSDTEKTDFMVGLLCQVCEARGFTTYDHTRLKTLYDGRKIPQDTRDAWDGLLAAANERAREAGYATLWHSFHAKHPELCG